MERFFLRTLTLAGAFFFCAQVSFAQPYFDSESTQSNPIGSEVPFPWGSEVPFPWGRLQGQWGIKDGELPFKFSFSVRAVSAELYKVEISQLEGTTEIISASGEGFVLRRQLELNVVISDGNRVYYTTTRAYDRPDNWEGRQTDPVIVISIAWFDDENVYQVTHAVLKRQSPIPIAQEATPDEDADKPKNKPAQKQGDLNLISKFRPWTQLMGGVRPRVLGTK